MANAPIQDPALKAALDSVVKLADAPATPAAPLPVPETASQITDSSDLLRKIIDGEDLSAFIPNTMREAYVRSLLGGAPFAHTFVALGGKLEVTFTEPPADRYAVHSRLVSRLSAGDAEGINALTLLFFLSRVHFEGTREDMVFTPPDVPEEWENSLSQMALSKAIQDEMVKRMGPLGGSVLRMLASMWIMFSGAWRHLIRTALPLSF